MSFHILKYLKMCNLLYFIFKDSQFLWIFENMKRVQICFFPLILLHYFNLFALKMHFVKLIGLIIIFPLNFSHQQKLALAISLIMSQLNMDYSKNLVVGQKIAHFYNDQIKVLDIFSLNSFKLVFKNLLRCFENNFQWI